MPFKLIVIFALVCHCCLTVQAQQTALLQADSAAVETGNPYVLHVSVPGGKIPDTLNFLPWQQFFSPKNLLSQSVWKRTGNQYTCDITVIFFEADTLEMPPLAFTFHQQDTIFTNPWLLQVYATPAPDDLNDMAPIKDIQREPVLWTDYLPMAAGIVAVLAILGLLFRWYSRRSKTKVTSRELEQLPHELAWRKLEALRKKELWQRGATKEYCAELTFILREYLEKRYQVPALESTSGEWMQQLSATDFPIALKQDLQMLLTQADLAKFAKAIPPESFYSYAFDFSKALIDQTVPVSSDEIANSTPKHSPEL
jgi:hypothetical protein